MEVLSYRAGTWRGSVLGDFVLPCLKRGFCPEGLCPDNSPSTSHQRLDFIRAQTKKQRPDHSASAAEEMSPIYRPIDTKSGVIFYRQERAAVQRE